MLAALHESLELKHVTMTAGEQMVFNERARLFLADHERGKRIFVRVGDTVFAAGKSRVDGNFEGEITLSDRDVTKVRKADESGTWHIQFAAELPPGDVRQFAGETILLEKAGVSVISDIDDTIKVTQIRDRHATLRNTFLRPFEPVPEMAAFYQSLARSNQAAFHYISASPWQLYLPLSEFVRSNGFPAGAFALKEFRWKNKSFLSLFGDPEKYKLAVIEPLLKRFPERRFILIGDSGERDPEIYATLARRHPRQIERIFIRDVTGESADAARYKKAFRDLPPGLWQVFATPRELNPSLESATPARTR
jgi:phosphatidate phosphatase APP1